MRSAFTLLKFLIFVVIACVSASVLFHGLKNPIKETTEEYVGIFDDVSSLHDDSQVRMSGVAIGKVKRIEPVIDRFDRDNPDAAHAHVYFSLDKKYSLYQNTKLAVRYESILGVRFLDVLTPDQNRGQRLTPGSLISLDHTISSFDVSRLFNGLKPVFEEVDPENLNKFIENILLLLQGSTSSLAEVLNELKTLSLFIQGRDELLKGIFEQISLVSETVPGKSQRILELLDQSSRLFLSFAEYGNVFDNSLDMVFRATDVLLPIASELRAAYDELYPPIDAFLLRVLPQVGPIANLFAISPELVREPYETSQRGLDHDSTLVSVLLGNFTEESQETRTQNCENTEKTLPLGKILLTNNAVICQ